MKFYRLLLWKAYFDKGFGLLNYLKYLIAVVGIGAIFKGVSLFWIAIAGLVYAVVCLVLGRVWFSYKLIETENEIQNIFNPFCKDVRKSLKRRVG